MERKSLTSACSAYGVNLATLASIMNEFQRILAIFRKKMVKIRTMKIDTFSLQREINYPLHYSKFRNFHASETLHTHTKFHGNEPSQNREITLPFTDEGKS